MGCATPPNVLKLGVSCVEDAAKTNKDFLTCNVTYYLKNTKKKIKFFFFFFLNRFKDNFQVVKRELPAETDTIFYLYIT